MSDSASVRVGVIGAGYWGANLVRNCYEMGILGAICDSSQRTLDSMQARYKDARLFTDVGDLLTDSTLDAVVIAAPAPMHAELALRAIAANKHVFVEKPLALNVAAAEAVVVAAEAAGLRVFVGHLLLYHPAVRKMLELIHAGRIGRVRHLRSRRLSWGRLRSQENVWWSFAPHDCAVMLAVMQDNPKSAIGVLRAFVRDNVGDFAYADFGFDNGRSAHIEVSWLDPDKSSRVDIFGSEGTLTLLDAREGATLSLTPCGDRSSESAGPELWRDEPQHIPLATGEPLRLELEAFCSAIRGEGEFPTEGREGLAVVRALAMIDNQSVPEHVGLAALA